MNDKTDMDKLSKTIKKNKAKLERIKAIKRARTKFIALVVSFIILVIIMLKGIDLLVGFFRENTIVKHYPIEIKFFKPVEIISLKELERRDMENKMLEEISKEVIEQYKNPKPVEKCSNEVSSNIDPKNFFSIIRKYETGNGTNTNPVALHNYCRAKRKWNEIGYNPKGKFCFTDQEEAELYVAYYVKKNCNGKTLDSCLCYWNTGTWIDTCDYSKGNLSFAN